ncbi:hypothetical protein GCM10022222_84890 [Amycolatopsis ultiminotia]|uniref:FAD dependent oxidoreductase domain-containing protein n=1 Tax=Amycolatopsis ultiminotia TaxID=543629 RepID=A0ABP6YTA3_9PSEU
MARGGAVKAAVTSARRSGARVFGGAAVRGIDLVSSGVVVSTATGDLRFGQIVLTAGAWLSALLPELPLEVVRIPTTWFREAGEERNGPLGSFVLERFPPFLREVGDGRVIWGTARDQGSAWKTTGGRSRWSTRRQSTGRRGSPTGPCCPRRCPDSAPRRRGRSCA